jgi:hypothetical protein
MNMVHFPVFPGYLLCPSLKFLRVPWLGTMAHAYTTRGGQRIASESSLGKNMRPYLKNKVRHKHGDVTQVVEHLPCKYKALNSNQSTIKKKKKIRKKIRKEGR